MAVVENSRDEEMLEGILEGFEDDGRLDMDYLDVEVVDESITLSGRVSSEEELEMVDEVMVGLKIKDYTNNIWVDDTLGFAADGDDTEFRGLEIDDGDIDDDDYDDDDDDDEVGLI